MIIGHYGVSFLVSRSEPKLPLWQTMVAVVWLDILHSSLELLGVERAAVLPGATAVVPIDLIYYPFSHSLAASLLWSLAAFGLYRFALKAGNRGALLMAAAVFSHFVLDLIAHRPDLPLWGEQTKVGLGLWNSIAGTFVVENAFVFGALALYLRDRQRRSFGERYGLVILAVAGSALFFTFPYAPFPEDVRWLEAFALLVYAAVPAVARGCEAPVAP